MPMDGSYSGFPVEDAGDPLSVPHVPRVASNASVCQNWAAMAGGSLNSTRNGGVAGVWGGGGARRSDRLFVQYNGVW
jgi:hypothetical protein